MAARRGPRIGRRAPAAELQAVLRSRTKCPQDRAPENPPPETVKLYRSKFLDGGSR